MHRCGEACGRLQALLVVNQQHAKSWHPTPIPTTSNTVETVVHVALLCVSAGKQAKHSPYRYKWKTYSMHLQNVHANDECTSKEYLRCIDRAPRRVSRDKYGGIGVVGGVAGIDIVATLKVVVLGLWIVCESAIQSQLHMHPTLSCLLTVHTCCQILLPTGLPRLYMSVSSRPGSNAGCFCHSCIVQRAEMGHSNPEASERKQHTQSDKRQKT